MTTIDIREQTATPTREELVKRARALAPTLRERAPAAEQERGVHAETMADIVASGINKVLIPRRFGGYELGFATLNEICVELSKGCTSTSWLSSFLNSHGWVVAHFPVQAQEDVWAEGPDVNIGGIFAPMGTVTEVDGGYRMSGRWPWSSGVSHNSWTILGSFIEGQTPPKLHLFLLGPGDFAWEDSWHNAGLTASGSHDTVVDNAFIPSHRVIPFEWVREGLGSGVEFHESTLYRAPLATGFGNNAAHIGLGAVEGAYEHLRESLKTRASSVSGAGLAQHPVIQAGLAETAAQIDVARMLLARTEQHVEHPEALDLDLRARCRRDNVYAVKILIEAIDRVQQLAGARGMYTSNPIQRSWRDLHAIGTHVNFNFQAASEFFGRLELGLEPPAYDVYY